MARWFRRRLSVTGSFVCRCLTSPAMLRFHLPLIKPDACANLLAVATSYVNLELRPIRSTSVTRLQRYYEPIRHPTWPSLSVTGVWLAVTRRHRVGFPVFRSISSSRHADTITPADPLNAVAISFNGNGLPQKRGGSASAIISFRGLLGVYSRFGLPGRWVT